MQSEHDPKSNDAIEVKVEASFSNLDRSRAERLEREILKAASQVDSRQVGDGFDQHNRHLGFMVDAHKLTKFCELVRASSARIHGASNVKLTIRGSLTL